MIRYEPDRIRIVLMADWEEGQADEVCPVCGCAFKNHAPVEGFSWLHRMCDGTLIKLVR